MIASTLNKGFVMTFENGLTISVQFGQDNYCQHRTFYPIGNTEQNERVWESNTAEIGIYKDREGPWVVFKGGDTVKGYLPADEVADYITKVKNAKSLEELNE